jgi:hypothetical protein
MEPGFIHKLYDVKYSHKIVKEVLKPLAVTNSFLLVWLQQLMDCHPSIWLNLCFLGGSLAWNKDSQIHGAIVTQVFWETALT